MRGQTESRVHLVRERVPDESYHPYHPPVWFPEEADLWLDRAITRLVDWIHGWRSS